MRRLGIALCVSLLSFWCHTAFAVPAKAFPKFGQVEHPITSYIKVTETAGIPRKNLPVEALIRCERGSLADVNSLRLWKVEADGKTPVPLQILEVHYPPETLVVEEKLVEHEDPLAFFFVEVVFLADVDADNSTRYEVTVEDDPGPSVEEALKVDGGEVGKNIITGPVVFETSPTSGQLIGFTANWGKRIRAYFYSYDNNHAIHYTPDVYTKERAWGHTVDWNKPIRFDPLLEPSAPPVSFRHGEQVIDYVHPFYFREWRGPLMYRTSRWGRAPWNPEADLGVTYRFVAEAPYILGSSYVEFNESGQFNAVRTAELVFSRHLFDNCLWIDLNGQLHTTPCYDYENVHRDFGHIAEFPAQVPCSGFSNEREGFGVAYLNLGLTMTNKYSGYASSEQAYGYFVDYHVHGRGSPKNFHYLSRPMVFRKNYTPSYVQKGSLYVSQFAIVVFRVDVDADEPYEDLIRWWKVLSKPLMVEAD